MKESAISAEQGVKRMGGFMAGVAGLLLLALCLSGNVALAKVAGPCSYCHTMHNSQDRMPMVTSGAGTGCYTCHTMKN